MYRSTCVAASAGLTAVLIGGREWAFLDPLTALVLASFLITAAVRIVRTSAAELTDEAPAAATLAGIEQAVAGTNGVKSYHAFRARQVGGKVAADVHVQVDPTLTVHQGHEIAASVKKSVLQTNADVIEVIVHIEPAE